MLTRLAAVLCGLLLASPSAFAASAGVEVGDPATAARVASGYGSVTSTFRTVAHNRAVGGVPNSYHLVNRAIDVARRPGVTHRQIEAALVRAGYRLIESLDEGDHSHFAFGSAATAGPPIMVTAHPAPPPSAPPPHPLLAADEHGVLLRDLALQPAGGGQLNSSPR